MHVFLACPHPSQLGATRFSFFFKKKKRKEKKIRFYLVVLWNCTFFLLLQNALDIADSYVTGSIFHAYSKGHKVATCHTHPTTSNKPTNNPPPIPPIKGGRASYSSYVVIKKEDENNYSPHTSRITSKLGPCRASMRALRNK